jgi:hypothetical protein
LVAGSATVTGADAAAVVVVAAAEVLAAAAVVGEAVVDAVVLEAAALLDDDAAVDAVVLEAPEVLLLLPHAARNAVPPTAALAPSRPVVERKRRRESELGSSGVVMRDGSFRVRDW